jgi:hypothetical protein
MSKGTMDMKLEIQIDSQDLIKDYDGLCLHKYADGRTDVSKIENYITDGVRNDSIDNDLGKFLSKQLEIVKGNVEGVSISEIKVNGKTLPKEQFEEFFENLLKAHEKRVDKALESFKKPEGLSVTPESEGQLEVPVKSKDPSGLSL